MGVLDVLAGPDALAELRDGGLDPERVRVLVGASGGPKWLVLHGLDRVVFPWLLEGGEAPVHAVGSSIGTWRFACLTDPAPLAAIDRFREAYVEQRYDRAPTPAEVTRVSEGILDALLGDAGVAARVEHPRVRLHVVTARFLHLGALEGRPQLLGLGLAALTNAIHRGALRASLERVVFDARGDAGPFAPWSLVPTQHVPLTVANARAALLASASIPGVLAGVRNPPGAPAGTYRDGGVVDYHFGAEIDPADGLALYPHFYGHLVPGWFDKRLSWRRTRGLRRVVVVAPSASFVASLPGGKIPDRADFERLSTEARIAAWREVVARSAELGDAFGELVASGRIGRVARPLS